MKIQGRGVLLELDEPIPEGFVVVAYFDSQIYIEKTDETNIPIGIIGQDDAKRIEEHLRRIGESPC